MPPSPAPPTPLTALQAFATRVTAAFATAAQVGAQPEVQLLAPLTELLHGYAGTQALAEVQLPGIGRPDLGVLSGGLLTGHAELKAPGKGANPKRFTDAHDRQQWIKFQNLPNLLYTDGQEWALFRTGERAGEAVRLSGGDVTLDGPAAATAANAAALDRLLRDFLGWQPYVPTQPRALAQVVAPLCRLLRDDVAAALAAEAGSALGALHEEWKLYFFPEADAAQFADAYAQTLTYALLLAHVSGAPSLAPTVAAETLRLGHGLLADTLDVLGQSAARQQVKVPLELLQRTIGAVQPALFAGGGGRAGGSGNNGNGNGAENGESIETDPWLYFYEDFLQAYDPEMRKKRGVYYTPVEVVQAQVRLVDELLRTRLGRPLGFVDENVATLDPACGTGTYLLAALRHGLARVSATHGPGFRAHAATTAAANLYAFELLVGPYAVAHLRLTQQVLAAGGTLPATGPHVLLADTLEAPHADPPSSLPLSYRRLGREHARAQQLKNSTPILVCLGNPPYRREQRDPTAAGTPAGPRHGGWVRFGDNTPGAAAPLLQDFLRPLKALGAGGHAKNLYNDYVYFWRWALWKTFGQAPHQQPGIVSFITGSSYLQGPGFAGMRQVMRETFEELWIIDLEGDSRGTRHTDNVFVIQTPVCIAVGLRTPAKVPGQPAAVRYCRLTGPAADKLAQLGAIEGFGSLSWQDCPTALTAPLLPAATSAYTTWPKLTDVFPWQANGMQFKRSWPIAETPELLRRRWQALVAAPVAERSGLLKEAESRTIHASHENFRNPAQLLPPLARLTAHTEPQEPMAYAFRSFDRQWMLPDARLCNRPRPELQRAHGPKQIYLTSMLTAVLGDGPAAVAIELLPDLHVFCGRGGADVIPLYRDAAGTQPNLPAGLLPRLAATYGHAVAAPDVLAYAYALLAGPRYGELFRAELETPGPRLPLTRAPARFAEAVALGRRLLALHAGGPAGAAPPGRARLAIGTPATGAAYPDAYRYDEPPETLHLLRDGTAVGQLTGLAPALWRFRVSGLRVVESWLSYRLLERAGRSSSPLDALRPPAWTFDLDLLRLLWTLEATLAEYPEAARLLDAVLAGPLLLAQELPAPTPAEQAGPGAGGRAATPGLFG